MSSLPSSSVDPTTSKNEPGENGEDDEQSGVNEISSSAINEEKDGETDRQKRRIKIAVAGCVHGEIETVYRTIASIEKRDSIKVDLVICCGDFQSVRNFGDLHHMHVNQKFRRIQSFYKYYSGEGVAPILTIFVGGNHEASGFLLELPNGGWVAPNIYYMGFANVLDFGGLRIAGLSGIFKPMDYFKGRYERPPFSNGSEISAYHVRALEVFRLRQLREKDGEQEKNCVDIVVSHDWPAGITEYGDVQQLLKFKPYFQEDIQQCKLGNSSTMQLLQELRPRYWFAAHLHCGFPALVPHETENGEQLEPTRFLALDKPIPGRHFLQILDFDVNEDAELKLNYDPTWLAILKSTDHLTEITSQKVYLPSKQSKERWDFRPVDEELENAHKLGDLVVPKDFYHTAPPLKEITKVRQNDPSSLYYKNPQSERFCQWVGIRNLNAMLAETTKEIGTPFYISDVSAEKGVIDENSQDEKEFGELGFVIDGAAGRNEAMDASVGTEMVASSNEWTAPVASVDDLDSLLAGFEAPPIGGGPPDAKRPKS
ncbi:unnamed protein product, partial [Mesorhabditis belari]|uniref:Lariat debranching enzyme C-terminal domain-containing protein n=1 Tax=Mesorhabditis belari TaxID=2138241 RepID=A0AAF3EXN6_9BILA